jgi:hypothetical protein
MKAKNIIYLGLLVVICLGILWALTGKKDDKPTQLQMMIGDSLATTDHRIDLVSAMKLIKNYRTNPKASMLKGGMLGRSAFDKILAQEGCAGIRYYYAQNDTGMQVLVLVGVDAKGEDIQTGAIMERIYPCPPFCNQTNEMTK